jgi:hypothetical protein
MLTLVASAGVNHYTPEWLFGPILAVGLVLVLTS